MGDPSPWRTAGILADAGVAIVKHDPRGLTGQTLLDEPFLRSQGVTDFGRYDVVPGASPRPLNDFWDNYGLGSDH